LLQQSVGFSSQTARLLSGVNGTIYVFSAFCCLLIIDRFGRRKMMLYGSLTCGSWYLIAALTIRQGEIEPAKQAAFGKATAAMFFLYYFCYGTSFAKVPWVYNSEINSLGWRARGAAAATGTNWICKQRSCTNCIRDTTDFVPQRLGAFCVTQFTKVGVNNLHWRFYLSESSPACS
jgi:hypothetical protein